MLGFALPDFLLLSIKHRNSQNNQLSFELNSEHNICWRRSPLLDDLLKLGIFASLADKWACMGYIC